MALPDRTVLLVSRAGAAAVLLGVVGALPWLAQRDPAYTVLRARYADREATPEALAAVRAELGLDGGPLGALRTWLAELARGDLGTSWVSGRPVADGLLGAVGVSATLMVGALAVALVVAGLVLGPALRRAVDGRPSIGTGAVAAALTAVPEVVLALVLLLVGAVWWGVFPPFGWDGPLAAVLPSLALGLPAGGYLGRLLVTAVAAVGSEPWLGSWRLAGFGRRETALAVLRRALPAVVGQVGLVVVGLTGGAVAVEQVFAIPGLGRLMLGAVAAQDLPTLRSALLLLLLLAVAVGGLAGGSRRLLLGRAVRSGDLRAPTTPPARRRREVALVLGAVTLLATVVLLGLPRDPSRSAHQRLAPPSWDLPFGADASGRDLLARVAHGALATGGSALAVTVLALLVGVVLGCFPRAVTGPVEVANAAPPVLVGLVAVGVAGPSTTTAVVAVVLVSWAPLAAHTAALVGELRAQPHVAVLPALGVGRWGRTWRHVVPGLLPHVARHAALRLPGVALALASLGFLGLGSPPPAPEWGRLLAEGAPYLERAPWAVAAPAGALVLLAVIAVGAAGLARGGGARRPRGRVSPTGVVEVERQLVS